MSESPNAPYTGHAGGADTSSEDVSAHASLRDDLVALSEAVLAISAVDELDQVLQRVVEHAQRYIDARYAALGILLPDAKGFAHFVFAGMSPEQVEAIGDFPRGHGVVGANLEEGRPLRLRDVRAHARSVGFPPHHPPMHSFLGVPIVHGGKVLGNLYLTEKRGAAEFSARDETLATLFARHAALALSNAQLHDALAASEARYRRLSEGAPQIVFALDGQGNLSYVNERVLDQLGWSPERLIGRPLRALVATADRASVDVHLRALVSGASRAEFPVRVRDARGALRHLDLSLARTRQPGRAEADDPQTHEGIPTYQGLARDVTDRHTLADEIAARTGELRSSREERRQLRDFVSLIMQAQEEERARIAGDLHDTTVQTLTAIGRRLRSLCERGDLPTTLCEELAELSEAALSEATELRRISRNLRPSVLDHLGLQPALRDLCDALDEAGIEAELTVHGDETRLGARARTALFRIAQEALTNVRRHSGADHVIVRLTIDDDSASLTVADNGCGYRPASPRDPAAPTGGLGTIGMRERARMMGGSLSIESEPGQGTTVSARMPLSL
jgi:PAS domain S-box-containing protein